MKLPPQDRPPLPPPLIIRERKWKKKVKRLTKLKDKLKGSK